MAQLIKLAGIFLILIAFANCATTAKIADLQMKCGKSNPSKEKHCTKYGTDSGFLCCWIKGGNDSPKCRLLSYAGAKTLGIRGKKTVTEDSTNYEVSCGNRAFYLELDYAALFVSMLFIFLF